LQRLRESASNVDVSRYIVRTEEERMPKKSAGRPSWDKPAPDVAHYENPAPAPKSDRTGNKREITEYFERRHARLEIAATTETPRGQVIDWIPIESQRADRTIAKPPPTPREAAARLKDEHAVPELEYFGCKRGPKGTVPVLRKKLAALAFDRPLSLYLSKSQPEWRFALPPGNGRGTHWHASARQSTICFGGSGQFSCFAPFVVPNTEEFSLLQIWLGNHDLPATQTVEAGWQVYKEITGDYAPHLFVYYTTNGYARDEDGHGGYNMDVDGWVQHDDLIFPGSTFAPLSVIDGEQRMIRLGYRLYRDNWWLSCQGRWVGYYPARLFMGNQSVFSTLGDHADTIAFWGEVSSRNSATTRTDMGSGRFPAEGWRKAAYFHNLVFQSDRSGGTTRFVGTDSRDDRTIYDIDLRCNEQGSWGSFAFVGGPGAP
jgi:hypothetical protein